MSKAWERYMELQKERPECFENSGTITIEFDEEVVKAFEQKTGKTIGIVYESDFNIMVVDLVYDAAGNYFSYERMLPAVKRGAVVCVPKWNDRFVLLWQYRHALRDYQYAFPRGYASEGCSPEENAKKELMEELEAPVSTVEYLGGIVPDSGLAGGEVSVYLCEIENYALHQGYEGIENVRMVTAKELEDMIAKGQITDGFTLGAYAFLKVRG